MTKKIAKQVVAAKKMFAAFDAAEARAQVENRQLSDKEYAGLGYVFDEERHCWTPDIPKEVFRIALAGN